MRRKLNPVVAPSILEIVLRQRNQDMVPRGSPPATLPLADTPQKRKPRKKSIGGWYLSQAVVNHKSQILE